MTTYVANPNFFKVHVYGESKALFQGPYIQLREHFSIRDLFFVRNWYRPNAETQSPKNN